MQFPHPVEDEDPIHGSAVCYELYILYSHQTRSQGNYNRCSPFFVIANLETIRYSVYTKESGGWPKPR